MNAMVQDPYKLSPPEIHSRFPEEGSITVLEAGEIEEVSGGFVCGGLCIAGAAFVAGLVFGAGVSVGWHAAQNTRN